MSSPPYPAPPPEARPPGFEERSLLDRDRHRRRIVIGAQVVASLGLAAGGAAGGLLAEEITGDPATAAAPLGSLVLGAGLSAIPLTRLMDRRGRVTGLRTGYLTAALGALLVIAAAALGSLPLLLTGNLLLGAGNTAVMLSRYVVADLSPPERRARAISVSLVAVAVGAVAGPILLGPAGSVSGGLGLPEASGLYLLAVAAFVLAPVLLETAGHSSTADRTVVVGAIGTILPVAPTVDDVPRSRTRLALGVLASANLTMVGIMAVLPVHLHGEGHGLGPVGVVVGLHVAAMYVASPLFGRWSDRYGARSVAGAGAAALAAVGLLPTVVDPGDLAGAVTLMVLLGLAWNAQVVAGSVLLTAGVAASRRTRLEGYGELLMSGAAATGALVIAAPLIDLGGFTLMAAATVPFNLVVLGVLASAWRPAGRGRPQPAS